MPHTPLSRHRLWPFALLALLALSCRLATDLNPLRRPTAVAVATVTLSPALTAQPSASPAAASPAAQATPSETAATATEQPPGGALPAWPSPAPLPAPFEAATPTADQARAVAELQASAPPLRDDVDLAMAYAGISAEMVRDYVAAGPPPQHGDIAPFIVLNIDSNVNVPIEARLDYAGEHAYFWFDTALAQPGQAALQEAAAAFDQIYEQNVANFGPEVRPGIDGDMRLHILNAAPEALCDMAAFCGLLGYFSPSDALPRLVNEYSNERDMFVMNGQHFGTATYIHVLAHEFRHMIEDNYDPGDADWEVEGSAMLAEDLAGFPYSAIDRGNAFLAMPDQQLNRWSDGNTYAHYGQGYVLNRYIYDRLGGDLYRQFAGHPADGLQAVTAVAEANGLDLDGDSLWLDWLAALAIHRHPQAPAHYRLGDGQLNQAAMSALSSGASLDTTVQQYAADYYRLQGDGAATISFAGSTQAPLLDTAAASGDHYWYAHRVNYSHMQLERELDLRQAPGATLYYDVYHDIERGYDFAYVSVSEDGGTTWHGLAAPAMQGAEAGDDPGDAAFTARFYTGQSGRWVQEQISLAPYAGKVIRLRFSYITDPLLTFGGLALDNIAIPEIGFYDDAEADVQGWTAQGFTRAPATLPQSWHIQAITFEGGAPQVTLLQTDAAARLRHTVDLQRGGEAILIVAASAPMTLEGAAYRLEVGP